MKRTSFILFLVAASVMTVLQGCREKQSDDKLNIGFEKYVMPNGLQVILHEDHSDPVISYAIMYHVGSGREVPGRTGFAHLFEHLLFTGSENVENGRFDRIIEGAGGSNNGFTSRDVTTYFEVFPKNALEKILWLESDRMGFFINSVTPRALAIQQNVVQNEKRQMIDNAPYGFTNYVIGKALYPEGHPYNWEVIGEMEDIRNASIEDVKSYYEKFYGPNNATLVLAGDFNPDSVKTLIDKYFGEIKPHGQVEPRTAMVPSLEKTKKLYHEDNFANVPEITLTWPVPQHYEKDAYALDFLGRLLGTGKKAPLYKVLIKEKKLTSAVYSSNYTDELAGEFIINIRANEDVSLKDLEAGIFEAFERFEKEGITEKDVERVKAIMERSFYSNISGVYGKAVQLAFYNTYLDDPGFIGKDIENIKAVNVDNIKRVYEKYIKGKPYVVTSFVPKRRTDMIAENSDRANVKEEDITRASQVEIALPAETEIIKAPSTFDRSVEPEAGPDPEARVPAIWKATLSNGIRVYGVENKELPLVDISLVIDGGFMQDRLDLPGVANMVSAVLPQGTVNRTPEELEEEIQLLGSAIRMNTSQEQVTMNVNALSRNFEKTIDLVREIILEPRWDTTEFRIARTRIRNNIIQQEARPGSIAGILFNKLLYGKNNILGHNILGTRESIDKITLEDLRTFYNDNFSPSVTRIQVAGNISREEVLKALKPLERNWAAKEVRINEYEVPGSPEKAQVWFYDLPGSRQSVIMIGYPALSRDDPDYVKADFANYRLGGNFTSILNQILREQKGFTYGASSYFSEMKTKAPFVATSSVRSDATLESLNIFSGEMKKYNEGISPEDLEFVKNSMIRSNAIRFESNNSLLSMLSNISKYGLPDDYIRKEEEVIRNMTIEENKAITNRYINPGKMYYVIVGDAATQLRNVEKAGLGKPVLMGREALAD